MKQTYFKIPGWFNYHESYDMIVDQMKGSWKDELILICLLVPAVAVFIPGWTPHIKAGFEALHSLPDYYKHLLYIACSASFGIKGAKGAMGLITKKGK